MEFAMEFAAELERVSALYDEGSGPAYPPLEGWENHCAVRVLRALPALSGHVLDLGAATGAVAVWLLRRNLALSIAALEPSRAAVTRGEQEAPADVAGRLTFHRGIGEALPFPDAVFDAAYSSHTLEHIEDHVPILAELRRVLKPGAPFFVLVPEENNYDTATHCHHWGLEQFIAHWQTLGVSATCRQECEHQLFAQIGFE